MFFLSSPWRLILYCLLEQRRRLFARKFFLQPMAKDIIDRRDVDPAIVQLAGRAEHLLYETTISIIWIKEIITVVILSIPSFHYYQYFISMLICFLHSDRTVSIGCFSGCWKKILVYIQVLIVHSQTYIKIRYMESLSVCLPMQNSWKHVCKITGLIQLLCLF